MKRKTDGQFFRKFNRLLKVDEPLARSFYQKECSQNNWSVRELKQQINAMLFERLALSKDSRAVMRMAHHAGKDPHGP